jgi:quercetin dioxygenase-like cupin family protein
MSSFFGLNPDTQGIVQRAGERPVAAIDPIRQGKGIKYERLVPFAAGNLLEVNIHIIEPGGSKTDNISNQGEAVGLLLEGQIELSVDGITHTGNAGNSFFFKAHLPTKYRNTGESIARLVWINTPQVH